MCHARKSAIVSGMAVSLALSGCVMFGETKTAEEDQTQTKLQATGLGALLGAGLGYAVGGKEGAAIGAALGAGTGYLFGSEVAGRKQTYASREQAIAEEVAWNEQFTQQVHASNQQLREDIQSYQKQVAQLKTDLRKGKATQADLAGQKQRMQAQEGQAKRALAQVESELKESKQRYQTYQAGGDARELQEWRGKLAKLEQEKKQLEKNIDNLSAMNSSL